MAITWDESLTTGVAAIDEQHKELFGRFDRLLAACKEGKGREEVVRLLDFLQDYVDYHFRAEESLMEELGYAELELHRDQHRRFREKLADLDREVKENGAGIDLVARTNRTMLDWIIQHVRNVDKRIALSRAV